MYNYTKSTANPLNELVALFNQGKFAQVIQKGESLAPLYPKAVVILNLLGASYAQMGNLDDALEKFEKSRKLDRNNLDTQLNIANCLKLLQRHEEAVAIYRKCLNANRNNHVAWNNLGTCYNALYRQAEAVEAYRKSITINAGYAPAYNNLGNVLLDLGQPLEAIAAYSKALEIEPNFAQAHNNLGIALNAAYRYEEAITSYKNAVEINPDYAEAFNNLGVAYQKLNRPKDAITYYTKALQLYPRYAEAHNGLGNALQALDRPEDAAVSYDKALQLDPHHAEAHNNLGGALQSLGRREEAIASYLKALQTDPAHAEARAAILHQQAYICDWEAIKVGADAMSTLGIAGKPALPFALLSLEDDPARQRIRSERHAAEKYPQQPLPSVPRPISRPDRLRIGYFSADFYNFPGMSLMAGMFEKHDRNKFEIYAFSYGPDKQDEMRQRLCKTFDYFIDVREMPDLAVAKLAREHEIDIAIHRNGYTRHSRTGIFAYRAAPIQINYLGYPGTLGADFIDYIIADKTVIPPEQREHYSEKVIYLPDCYQPNDDTRIISDRKMTRTEFGLPENGFVFCCFNQNYKISPAEFDIWMRLLKKVDGSVLWLLRTNNWVEENLAREAEARGVKADRIIYADRLPNAEHLARHRLADLFLDTFNYNAHTTASDALWVGLPVVTKAGQQFAARVAASLLNAIELPELITHTEQEYERLALNLATHPEKLSRIKDKLAKNRDTKPLFDTERYTRHIESAYQQAYSGYFDDLEPGDMVIREVKSDICAASAVFLAGSPAPSS